MAERLLPAYPLFVKDPYFSFWAKRDVLNEADVMHWSGAAKRIYGVVRVGGTPYAFLGTPEGVARAEQTQLSVSAFTTDYTFRAGKATLRVSFVSPLVPDDLSLLSQPVCYLKYEVEGAEDVEVQLAAGEEIARNDDCPCRRMRGGVIAHAGVESAVVGLARQLRLSNNCDDYGADQGYYYITGRRAFYVSSAALGEWLRGGEGPAPDGDPMSEGDRFAAASSREKQGFFTIAFDDTGSIDYFGEIRKGYYMQTHTVFEAIEEAWREEPKVAAKLAAFDADLRARSADLGETGYRILCAALRQSVGAHKLIGGPDGPLFLSKECRSNGCIATVDVSYPSAPLYLLYAPELVRGMLRPILHFASLPAWPFPFAPHDAGTYPHCTGQVYGTKWDDADPRVKGLIACDGRETRFPFWLLPDGNAVYSFENQMPVEESANVLILMEACRRADGDLALVRKYFGLISRWAEYLAAHGLRPFKQLCTDDFAGHLGNNLNLSIKAAVALACFASLCFETGNADMGATYRAIAEKFAAEICAQAEGRGQLPLVWDGDGYSLKYNLLFDKVLGLGLFPQSLCEREADAYLARMNRYGTPLDGRAAYTKSDWIVWTAALCGDPKKKRAMLAPVEKYLCEAPDRIPFSDWYDTVTGRTMGFMNRTVQGGCFAVLLEAFYRGK